MHIKNKDFGSDIKWYDITNQVLYMNRRRFIKTAGKVAVAGAVSLLAFPFANRISADDGKVKLRGIKKSPFSTDEAPNKYKDVTSYNNFYELGLDKRDPARNAGLLKTRPWTVTIDGLVNRPSVVDVDRLIQRYQLEERIYRLRCVEAWSMVIPWVGIPLAVLIKDAEPTSQAKYVHFTTLNDPELFIIIYRFIPHIAKKQLAEWGALRRSKGGKRRAKDLERSIGKVNRIINALNIKLHKALRMDDTSFVSRTTLESTIYRPQNIVVLRAVLANPLTDKDILKEVVDTQNRIGMEIWSEFEAAYKKIAG